MGGHARSRRAGRKENFTKRFTTDYDLPNDCNYSESCASIGLAMFGIRMANITRTLASLGQYVYSVGEGGAVWGASIEPVRRYAEGGSLCLLE